MRFDIKKWQDKHLIKESKLKEMDFKDKAAFDKYQSKHQMRPSTKVNVGGKDTTAGVQMMQHDKDSDEYKAAYKVASREVGDGEKKTASTSSAHASKFTPEQKKSVVSSAAVRISRDISNEFGRTKHPKYNAQMMMDPISKIYMTGMSIDDAMTEIGKLMGTDYENTRMTSYGELKKEKHSLVPMTKKFEKQLRAQMERVYTGEADSWINGVIDDEYQNIDPEVDKRVKASAAKQDAIKKKESDASMKAYKIQQAKDKAEKLKNRTPKEIEKAKNQFKFSEYDYQSPKEYRDNVKDILQKTYDLDKVDPDRLQQMIDGADDYFSDEARSAGKAGRRSKPTSAKDFANYIEQYFDEDGIEPKNESVASRSARIQEAKMYRTIQELKGLERAL